MPETDLLEPLPPGALVAPAPQTPPPAPGFEPIPGGLRHVRELRQLRTADGLEPLLLGALADKSSAFANGLEPLPRGALAQPRAVRDEQRSDPNAPWYEKAWDWSNKPLLDLHREGAGPIESGVEDIASGLTSPLSIALFAGTAGSGAALRALGIGAKELPLVIRGGKALLSASLTATQVSQVIQESPRVLDALKEGDYATAKRLAVHVAAGTAFAALGGRAAYRDIYSPTGVFRPTEQNAGLREEFGKYQGDVEA